MLARLGRLVARRPGTVLGVALAIAALAATGLPRLEFETSQNALIGENSRVAEVNARYQRQFGGEPMLVLLSGDPVELFSAENLPRLEALESSLRASDRVAAVVGPLTAIQFAAEQVKNGPELIAAAKQSNPEDAAAIDANALAEATRLLEAGEQTLTNPAYLRYLLFGADGEIRPILRDAFPDKEHGLIVVRLAGNLPIADLGAGAGDVEQAVADNPIPGFTTLSTGSPVLLRDINDYLQGGMTTLGGLALLAMVVVLGLVFRRHWRLLPLVIVVVGVAAAFGLMGYLGLPLNLVTISGLPILIGMGVDFTVQVHSRFEEELELRPDDAVEAAGSTMAGLGPALVLALIAALLGFIALQLSRVPMIRQFGLLLDIGVAVLFALVLFVPLASLALRERHWPRAEHAASVAHGRPGLLERAVRTLMLGARRATGAIVVIALVLVALGLAAEGRFTIQTDPERWVDQDGATVRDLRDLRDTTGFSSELGFLIEADDVTSSEVVTWMQTFAERQLAKHPDELLRFTSFPAITTAATTVPPGPADVRLIASIAPTDVQRSLISTDRTRANLVFPIAAISLGQREELLRQIEADLDPPAGVRVSPSGLAVVGIALVDALEANRATMTWAALGLVAVWLLLTLRRPVRVVLILTPVLVAVAASAIVVFATGLELSPLTAVSGPLVIAVCTEFAVLIAGRYDEERAAGRAPVEAIEVGAVRIGRALVASGLTLVAGFGVMAASSFPLLRDFGIIVALNALVALLVALVVLPPLLIRADRDRPSPNSARTVTIDETDRAQNGGPPDSARTVTIGATDRAEIPLDVERSGGAQ